MVAAAWCLILLRASVAGNCMQEPPRELGHTITAIQGGKLLLFGGYKKSGLMNLPGLLTWDYSQGLSDELWEFTPLREKDKMPWCKVETTSDLKPTARVFHAATYSNSAGVDGTLYISGGSGQAIGMNDEGGSSFLKLCSMNDLWALDIHNRTWTLLNGNPEPQRQEVYCTYSASAMASSNAFLGVLTTLIVLCFLDGIGIQM